MASTKAKPAQKRSEALGDVPRRQLGDLLRERKRLLRVADDDRLAREFAPGFLAATLVDNAQYVRQLVRGPLADDWPYVRQLLVQMRNGQGSTDP